jgi:four helix bundle protein
MKKKERKVEDLVVWQQAILVANSIYCNFADLADFGFRNQIQRASISISNNIAEGFYRKSDREFKRFLIIALGSLGELKSMLVIAVNLNYIHQEKQIELMNQLNQIGKMINSLINYLISAIERNK